MESILSNWNLFRFIRLGLGVFILVQGIMTGDKFSLILGSLFTLMPVFNVGCCGAGGCGVDYRNTNSTKENINEISYEEVVDTK